MVFVQLVGIECMVYSIFVHFFIRLFSKGLALFPNTPGNISVKNIEKNN